MYRDGFCTVSRTDSILRSRAACVMPCMLADGMPGARPRLDDWFHVAVMSQPQALACGDRERPATQQVANGREPSLARTQGAPILGNIGATEDKLQGERLAAVAGRPAIQAGLPWRRRFAAGSPATTRQHTTDARPGARGRG